MCPARPLRFSTDPASPTWSSGMARYQPAEAASARGVEPADVVKTMVVRRGAGD